MVEQDLVQGDPVYPHYQREKRYFIEGNAVPLIFLKGELATFDVGGFLVKLTTTKILGLVQIRFNVTGGLAGDDSIGVTTLQVLSRVLLPLPAGATAGNTVQINGADGVADVVVSAAAVDVVDLGLGKIFELYKKDPVKVALAGDLGVVDLLY